MPNLSGYRIMWMMALFDLPVCTKAERSRATKFRQYLLDEGFEMVQFSVYVRVTKGKEMVEAITKRIGKKVPPEGKVDILCFTDVQYGNIVSYRGHYDRSLPKKPEQLALF